MSDSQIPAPVDKRGIFGWCMYDWANSPYTVVVMTWVIPAYFADAVAADPAAATARWGFMTSAAALTIAVLSPLLGAIADQGRGRKPWLAGCTVLVVVMSAALWFVRPNPADTGFLLWVVALGIIGFELGMVFYNAMLPGLAPDRMTGRVSGWAWGLGYFGGVAGLLVVLFGFVQADPAPFGLDKQMAEHVRIAGPLVAVWLALFCLPTFLLTRDQGGTGLPASRAAREGLRTLVRSFAALPRHGRLVRYLIARMLYTDGINTLFAFGGLFAAGSFGMDIGEVIAFGILLAVTAGFGALAFAWVDDWIGSKPTVLIGVAAITVIGVPLLMTESVTWFWILGGALGAFFGPVQAASRSLMARMAPIGMETEMFGLYALSGKVTAFAGPFLVGVVIELTGSQRWGLATVLPFLVVGGLLLATVREGGRETLLRDGES